MKNFNFLINLKKYFGEKKNRKNIPKLAKISRYFAKILENLKKRNKVNEFVIKKCLIYCFYWKNLEKLDKFQKFIPNFKKIKKIFNLILKSLLKVICLMKKDVVNV